MVLCGTKNGSSMAPLEETFEAPFSNKCSIYGYAILSLVLSVVMLFFGSVIISFSLPMVLSTVFKFFFFVPSSSIFNSIYWSRAGRYITCDCHAYLVSKAGSVLVVNLHHLLSNGVAFNTQSVVH